MSWKRNDPDPLEARRRQLAEQERLLLEQRRQLTEKLHGTGEFSSAGLKPTEPPVWRMEEESDISHRRSNDPTPARKRDLARQRQRDKVLFFLFIGVFLIVLGIVVWVAYVHNVTTSVGS
jgi:hypothetical protein